MKGILFKPDMIRAITEGRKTVTRRQEACLKEINENPGKWHAYQRPDGDWCFVDGILLDGKIPEVMLSVPGKKPRYKVGDIVYIKEAHYKYGYWLLTGGRQGKEFQITSDEVKFSETPPTEILTSAHLRLGWYKRSPLFMPEKDARYFLKITSVRPERLHQITEEGSVREGLSENINDYALLWDSINKQNQWDSNPWVWRIEFEVKK